jgi:type II secretory pathway pseudopilin PulG
MLMNKTPLTLRLRYRTGFTPTSICIVAEQARAEDKQYCRQTLNSPTIRKLVKGFTIMELLVVSILMIIVVLITSQFWMWFSPSVTEMIAREHILREARMAMQNLAADFGSAVGAAPIGNNRLVLCRDGGDFPDGEPNWAAPDVLVDYFLEGNTLQRSDLSTGAEFTVADGISNLTVEQVSPTLLRITLALECRTVERQLVFMWSAP